MLTTLGLFSFVSYGNYHLPFNSAKTRLDNTICNIMNCAKWPETNIAIFLKIKFNFSVFTNRI